MDPAVDQRPHVAVLGYAPSSSLSALDSMADLRCDSLGLESLGFKLPCFSWNKGLGLRLSRNVGRVIRIPIIHPCGRELYVTYFLVVVIVISRLKN